MILLCMIGICLNGACAGGRGISNFVPPLCIMTAVCGPTYSNAPTFGFDTYLRIGTDNTRWMNQVSFAFARNVGWSHYQECDPEMNNCTADMAPNGRIPAFFQAMFTTGIQVNTNRRGNFGFSWEIGATAGGWTGESGAWNGVGGLKVGMGVMLFHDWEVSWQFIAGNVLSAQLLVGYNVQWGR